MFLLIDNYDSFVHNLARYFELAGVKTRVVRNDETSLEAITKIAPEALILSPGPCTPSEAGICIEAVRHFGAEMPIFGVCLGHQAIAEAYGGQTIKGEPVHGKASEITHKGDGLFQHLPSPLSVGRYHSLKVGLPKDAPFEITARLAGSNEIMAFAHTEHPVYGVQFHPESILTEHGQDIVARFVALAKAHNETKKAAA